MERVERTPASHGFCAGRVGNHDDAQSNITRCRGFRPSWGVASASKSTQALPQWSINNFATFLSDQGRLEEAATLSREAVELAPGDALPCWNLSTILEKQGDMAGAIELTEEYIRRGDPDADGEERLAELRAKLLPPPPPSL